jgi:hypothetical protein
MPYHTLGVGNVGRFEQIGMPHLDAAYNLARWLFPQSAGRTRYRAGVLLARLQFPSLDFQAGTRALGR